LSDLQFGKNHRYPDGEGSFNSLYAKLAEDLDELAEKCSLRPTAIVVTGDIAEWGSPEEYKAANGFLDRLATHLRIDRQRVVLLPGNHDVNRKLCQGARLTAEGSSRPFEEPYFAKFRNFQQFFNQFYAGTDVLFDEDHLFQVYRFLEEQVLIVGFNSCLRESELDQDRPPRLCFRTTAPKVTGGETRYGAGVGSGTGSGLRRTEFNFRGRSSCHGKSRVPAKIEFCTSEPKALSRGYLPATIRSSRLLRSSRDRPPLPSMVIQPL
jgi:hypothetical protein